MGIKWVQRYNRVIFKIDTETKDTGIQYWYVVCMCVLFQHVPCPPLCVRQEMASQPTPTTSCMSWINTEVYPGGNSTLFNVTFTRLWGIMLMFKCCSFGVMWLIILFCLCSIGGDENLTTITTLPSESSWLLLHGWNRMWKSQRLCCSVMWTKNFNFICNNRHLEAF